MTATPLTITHPETGKTRTIYPPALPVWESRGWTAADTTPDAAPETPATPAKSAPVADWAAYLDTIGVDPAGMTKAEMQAAAGI